MQSWSHEKARPIEVLLVEDNDDDVLLTRKGFEKAKLAVNLHHAEDGQECMSFLRKQGEHADAPTPDLILLDLNMPVMDGRETLEEIVADERFCGLPVVVLTTSGAEEDLVKMYRLRCNSYITKPVDFTQFQRVIHSIDEYWFSIVKLPPPTDPSRQTEE